MAKKRRKLNFKEFLVIAAAVIAFVVTLSIIAFVIAVATQNTQPKACTEEAKLCPDGSAVGRVPPNCDFAPCPTNITNSSDTINFAGYTWDVRTSDGLEEPGPNRWNDSNESVWVDTDGNLHMKIRKVGDKWYSSEIDMQKSLGYGRYVFMTESNLDKYDKNIVAAMFLYSFSSANNYPELDIEYGNWNGETIDNALFTAQPVTSESQYSFNVSSVNGNYFSNIIDWNSNRVIFQVIDGHYVYPPTQDFVEGEWNYTGSHIPKTTEGQIAIINFWLYNGVAPSNGQDAELIISNFTFIPNGT